MRGNICKRIAAVVVALCVGVTFIPLAGEYAFAEEPEGTPVVTNPTEAPAEVEAEPEAVENEPAAQETEPAGESVVKAAEQDDESGWVIEGDNTYYYVDGEPAKGKLLLEDEGSYYYFDESDGILQTGWIEIDGAKVYYADASKGGALAIGKTTIESAAYFFNEEAVLQTGGWIAGNTTMYAGTDGKLYNGWKTIDGKKYYFKNHVKQTGLQTIGSDIYGFSAAGVMLTGVKKVGGKLYYFQTNGKAIQKKGWYTCPDKKKRYFYNKGVLAVGVKTISSKLYFFNTSNGTLRGKGFFTYNKKEYYSKGGGVLATGWQALKRDGKLNGYFFYKKTGVMAKDTTIKYLKIPKNGRLHEAYALGIQKLNKTKWTLRQAYKNSYKIKYQGRWWRQKTAEQYAMKGFKKNKGNCYVMASTFYIQAKLLGYNVRQIKGKVAYRYPHSWTQIKNSKGKWRVYDPNFRNETGRSGWDIYYGKKGTWRYTNYSVFQK